jgi:hypothetical protein
MTQGSGRNPRVPALVDLNAVEALASRYGVSEAFVMRIISLILPKPELALEDPDVIRLLTLLGEPKVVYNELASALGIGSLG